MQFFCVEWGSLGGGFFVYLEFVLEALGSFV